MIGIVEAASVLGWPCARGAAAAAAAATPVTQTGTVKLPFDGASFHAEGYYYGSNDWGFSGGFDFGFPVVLDLNGDGIKITQLSRKPPIAKAWMMPARNRTSVAPHALGV